MSTVVLIKKNTSEQGDSDEVGDEWLWLLLLTEIDKVLVSSVGREPSDVQVGPESVS